MTIAQIGERIDAHLKRIEHDPTLHKCQQDGRWISHFWYAGAAAAGRYVMVTYIAYQGTRGISKADAARYLAWLHAGNIGKHWEALREKP